jgi:ABC-type ATPase involved in cell division/predicted acetyltransferase
MPNINLSSKIINDKYTEYVFDSFDIQNQLETSVSIPINLSEIQDFDWNVGVILGGSGSGKTTILKNLGEIKSANFDNNKSLISNFDWLDPKDATFLLTSMGLSSVPTWLRPYNLLSNGEQYRANLAYLVSSSKDGDIILIDEFTSVVDRDVAKAMSFALQKYIRKLNKKIILASCHFDIIDWLMPDWSYSPLNGGGIVRADCRRQSKPKITLQINRVESEAWNYFKKHHYLTEKVNDSCIFLLFEWNEKPVGIVAIINQPRNGCPNGFAISRIVILPDFQGMGMGVKLCEFACGIIKNQGGVIYIKTINPALGIYFNNSNLWRGTALNGKERTVNDKSAKNRLERASYCHEYIGDAISGYEDLLLPIDKMRYNKMVENQLQLF